MPTTTTAALILILAVLPGLVGERIYQTLVGVHWREREWRSILRLIGFSVAGVTIYTLAAAPFDFWPPIHLMPSTYQKAASDIGVLTDIFPPYAGHIAGGTVAGLVAAWGAIFLAKLSPRSAFPSAWDDFVRTYADDRWVVVGLQNEEIYAGRLLNADISVPTGERDIVLGEPCIFSYDTNNYRALNYQYLFIPAESLYSIAGVSKPTDSRLLKAGELLFEETLNDGKEATAATASTQTAGGAAPSTGVAPLTAAGEAARPSTSATTDTEEAVAGRCSPNPPAGAGG